MGCLSLYPLKKIDEMYAKLNGVNMFFNYWSEEQNLPYSPDQEK